MITILKKLRIKVLEALDSPTMVIVADGEGNLGSVDISEIGGGSGGNIDGGAANTVYLASQNIDGGAAAQTINGTINGGNATNA